MMEDEVAVLKAELARANALLRQLEWSGVWPGDKRRVIGNYCPVCGQHGPLGHADDCVLAAHLRDREGGAALSIDVVTRLVEAADRLAHEHKDATGLESIWMAGVKAAVNQARVYLRDREGRKP